MRSVIVAPSRLAFPFDPNLRTRSGDRGDLPMSILRPAKCAAFECVNNANIHCRFGRWSHVLRGGRPAALDEERSGSETRLGASRSACAASVGPEPTAPHLSAERGLLHANFVASQRERMGARRRYLRGVTRRVPLPTPVPLARRPTAADQPAGPSGHRRIRRASR